MKRAWVAPTTLALVLALRCLSDVVVAVMSNISLADGEGAVVHAGQLLARGVDPYSLDLPGFVSADYPPLAYAVTALGVAVGPFFGLRLANLLCALVVVAIIAWEAREDRVVAVMLGASFLALYPVALWLPAARVDILSTALTLAAVQALRRHSAPLLFGVLATLAVLAKPTSALVIGTVLVYELWREPRRAVRPLVSLAAVAVVSLAILALRFDLRGLYTHLIVYNVLPYDVRTVALLFVVASILLGPFIVLAFRTADGSGRAYLVGAVLVALLVGRQGSSLNYLLDLSAACCLALAPIARTRLRWGPAMITGELVATLVLSTTGPFALGDLAVHRAQFELVARLPSSGMYFAEDSGLLISAGIEPFVDDTFDWAQRVAKGQHIDEVTPLVERGAFDAIIAEAPLETIATGPDFRRARWPANLVEAVLGHYVLDASTAGAYRYVPRR